MSWLLDTCVISELAKPRPNRSIVGWIRDRADHDLFLSAITIGELEKGIARLPDSQRKATLSGWVRHDLTARFHQRILAIDIRVAARWGALAGASEKKGRPLPVIDGLIAATSLQHDLTVVTRNTADLERWGARCFDPWGGSS